MWWVWLIAILEFRISFFGYSLRLVPPHLWVFPRLYSKKISRIFFAMLNLAFSMVLYGSLLRSSLGSTDGFSVSQTTILGWTPENKYALFAAIVFVCAVGAVLVQCYLKTALGTLTTAIRDNELRVEYLGFSVARAIHLKYIMSAGLASFWCGTCYGARSSRSGFNGELAGFR